MAVEVGTYELFSRILRSTIVAQTGDIKKVTTFYALWFVTKEQGERVIFREMNGMFVPGIIKESALGEIIKISDKKDSFFAKILGSKTDKFIEDEMSLLARISENMRPRKKESKDLVDSYPLFSDLEKEFKKGDSINISGGKGEFFLFGNHIADMNNIKMTLGWRLKDVFSVTKRQLSESLANMDIFDFSIDSGKTYLTISLNGEISFQEAMEKDALSFEFYKELLRALGL